MSKKMLKRSLVLGALMTFVITGSAMAAELTIEYKDGQYVATGSGIDSAIKGYRDELMSSLNDLGLSSAYRNSGEKWAVNISDNLVGNRVEIKGNTNDLQVVATYNDADGAIEGSTLIVTDATNTGRLYAAEGVNGDLKNNTVQISNSTVGNVCGACVFTETNGSSNAINNSVIIKNDSTVTGSVWGASLDKGDTIGNIVEITNSTVKVVAAEQGVYGALSYNGGNTEGNTLKINDSTIEMGNGYINISGGSAGRKNIVVGGFAKSNNVEITGNTTITGNSTDIFGGFANDDYATNNKVAIDTDGELNLNIIYGGYSGISNASENSIEIKNGTINAKKIYGGRSSLQSWQSGRQSGNANENTVTISGGVVTSDVYGGYSQHGVANNNTVNISGSADVANANILGSNKTDSTGNTLNIGDGWSGSVKSIQKFNVINIGEAQWGTAVVEVESLALVNTTVNVETVRVAGDDETFAPNGSSVLIKSGSITGDVSADSSVNVFKGVATIYDATVVKDGNDVKIQLAGEDTATYNAGEMNPQVLVIGESRAAATAFTNQGSDLIETGLDALARDKAEADTKVFAAVYGSEAEYATGSEVKVNGWSGIVGVGKTNANGLTIGAFFENGEGNYRTYNDVNGEFMRGDGDACYNGGGFLVRKDNANGVYTEASLRVGNLQNELRNAVRGSEGLTGYDIDTFYYGAHVGVGKIIPRGNDGDSIDIYGKFIYTHHDSEDFTIDGDKFHFDSVDSERLRFGFRINEVQTNKLTMYYGAAWEYEFGGDSDNTVVGYDLSTPSLGGSSVIGEVGMHYTASEKWSFDLNARAYGGQRDGFSGSVQANYAF